jgi:hypothetical protein
VSELVLLSPPDGVRAACCAGLAKRAEHGKGGTAASVPFASRVCAGGPVTQDDLVAMLTHMAAIETAMIDRGLADPALSVAWLLWGGDEGRDWAEEFVLRERPVVAAPTQLDVEPDDQDPEAPGWIRSLNQLAEEEATLLARLHELMEAGVEFAVSRLRSKVVNSLSRPSAALKAACGGLTHRDTLLASMAAAPGAAEAVRLVPSPILARVAPSIEMDESLRQVFVQLSGRLRDLVGAHQDQVAAALAAGGVPDVALAEARHLWTADLDGALTAATDELMGIVARVARQAADLPAEGEVPTGRVPASLAFRLLSGAGGGDPGDGTRQDYVRLGDGDVLVAGVALGVTALRAIGKASMDGALHGAKVAGTLVFTEGPEFAITARTTWRWGGSARPFPSHQRLHGQSWDSENERNDVCRNPERFPPVATLYPGDHLGCSCSLTVQLVLKQTKAARATFTPDSPAAAPAPVYAPPKGRPVTTVAPPTPPVLGRRGDDTTPKQAMVIRGINFKTGQDQVIPERKMQAAQRMADHLQAVLPHPSGKTHVVQMTNSIGDLGQGSALGLAQRGQHRLYLNSRKLNEKLPEPSSGWMVDNGTKVTQLEYVMIHEWGHTMDIDPDKTLAFFKKVKADGGAFWPSEYAETNDAELFAEAFADWHIDPDAAHPVSKQMAEAFGWKIETPLKALSALAKKG